MAKDHSYWAWCLRDMDTGKLVRQVFNTRRELVAYYSMGAGTKSVAWKDIKKFRLKPVQVLIGQTILY